LAAVTNRPCGLPIAFLPYWGFVLPDIGNDVVAASSSCGIVPWIHIVDAVAKLATYKVHSAKNSQADSSLVYITLTTEPERAELCCRPGVHLGDDSRHPGSGQGFGLSDRFSGFQLLGLVDIDRHSRIRRNIGGR